MGTPHAEPVPGLGPAASRPRYREPHPVRTTRVLVGLAAGSLRQLLFGLLGGGPTAYAWWSLAAGGAAWLVALVLARHGDRGVAVGVALATATGWSVVATVVALIW